MLVARWAQGAGKDTTAAKDKAQPLGQLTAEHSWTGVSFKGNARRTIIRFPTINPIKCQNILLFVLTDGWSFMKFSNAFRSGFFLAMPPHPALPSPTPTVFLVRVCETPAESEALPCCNISFSPQRPSPYPIIRLALLNTSASFWFRDICHSTESIC